ncbi:hypothetical protein XO10_05970 [Marinitoga sp. 1135]|uniref:DUF4351 domain-containing protein n=1 Tax=Marinitoga sp. 1135 TaxID=1643333 RepID=UPI001586CBFB|nr:DUF4351 domain-containing protein [Marinitoga sp. 1135]NUU95826.1 hypothetical protein [Marinitoga sp. 1135]
MFERFAKALDENMRENYEKGLHEGLEKGLQEGLYEGEKKVLKNLLLKKFGKKITPYIDNIDSLNIETIEYITENIFGINYEETVEILNRKKKEK